MDFNIFDGMENIEPMTDEELDQKKTETETEEKKKWYEKTVPERYWKESLDTYKVNDENRNYIEMVRRFIKSNKKMLLMCGKEGTGKTHLACGIMYELWKGIYTTSFDLCLDFDMGKDYRAVENRREVLNRYCGAKLLVIDEIGGGMKDIEVLLLRYVINEFYNSENKMLILITNMSKEEFTEYIGKSRTDRLFEVCSTINFTGESYRRK